MQIPGHPKVLESRSEAYPWGQSFPPYPSDSPLAKPAPSLFLKKPKSFVALGLCTFCMSALDTPPLCYLLLISGSLP